VTMTTGETGPDRDGYARCGGPRKHGRGACTQAAGWGTPHPGVGRCKLHGGSTPTHVRAGQRALAERAVRTYGLPVDIAADEALLEEIRWTAGHVVWLRERIQEMEPDALIWGVRQRVDQDATEFPGVNITEMASPSVWLDLYQRERKHLVDVCKAALSAGIEERRIRLAESRGVEMAAVVRRLLTALDLSAEQWARVPGLLQQAVGAITGTIIEGEAA
jgi:hypothetical protein